MGNESLKEISAALEAHGQEVGKKFQEYEMQIKENGSVALEVKSALNSMAEDYQGMLKDLQVVKDDLIAIEQKGVKGHQAEAVKSMGQQFIESDSFKSYQSGHSSKARIELKNTIIGEGGSPQDPTNTIVPLQTMPGIVGGAFRNLRVADIIPGGIASGNQIHYTRELTFTNNAAETAEGSAKPETDLTFEAVDTPVRTIAHFIKVSKQVLDDAPALQSYIDQRMRYGVMLRKETQIINGNGTSPNLSGILDSGNFTSLTATSGETKFDFVNRAKYKVIESDYQADVILMNPADWGAMERTKTTTGAYVGGENAIGYLNNGLTPTLWGLPVLASNSVPSGTMICMATDATMFWDRQQTAVEIFDQNQDDVEKNLLTIRAESRGAFTVFRPAAIVAGTLPS